MRGGSGSGDDDQRYTNSDGKSGKQQAHTMNIIILSISNHIMVNFDEFT